MPAGVYVPVQANLAAAALRMQTAAALGHARVLLAGGSGAFGGGGGLPRPQLHTGSR